MPNPWVGQDRRRVGIEADRPQRAGRPLPPSRVAVRRRDERGDRRAAIADDARRLDPRHGLDPAGAAVEIVEDEISQAVDDEATPGTDFHQVDHEPGGETTARGC
jgi:hypothetical protein